MGDISFQHKDCVPQWKLQGGGLHDTTKRICDSRSRNYMMKALYGFQWAPKAWYEKNDLYLRDQGLLQYDANHNLYYTLKIG